MDKWITIGFQLLNFLVLVYLLKRFLYGRIIKAMDDRQAKIAGQLEAAEKTQAGAEQQAADFQHKNEEFDAQRDDMLAKAKQDVEAERKKMMAAARGEIDALQGRWRDSVAREEAAFLADLRQRITRHTAAVARRALADLAGADLESRVAEAFLARIAGVPEDERKALAPLPDQERRMTVRSAFEIPEDRRQPIRDALAAHIAEGLDIEFETSPEVICGIELVAAGRKLAWSIDNYLDRLEEALREAFEQQPPEEALQKSIERDVERDEGKQAEQAAEEQQTEEKEEQPDKPESTDAPAPPPDEPPKPPEEPEQKEEASDE